MRTFPRIAEHEQDVKYGNSIVAVPGLGASPEWTWKSKNKVDWLRDVNMLCRSIPNARIMVFEYESQWFGRGSIDQRLSSVADQLVLALFHSRSVGSQGNASAWPFSCGLVLLILLLSERIDPANRVRVSLFGRYHRGKGSSGPALGCSTFI